MQNNRDVTADVMHSVVGRMQEIKCICDARDCIACFYAVDPPQPTQALGHLEGWIEELQEQMDALRDLADRLAEGAECE